MGALIIFPPKASPIAWCPKQTPRIGNFPLKVFISSRHKTRNTHGTGCTLSSAITTFFSCGKSIKKACEQGIKYVNSAILTNPKYGKGHGPINHLNSMKIDKKFK